MTKQLAGILLPETPTQAQARQQVATQLAEAQRLERDGAVVDQLSTGAPDMQLDGQLREPQIPRPAMVAAELEELAASSKDTLPLFRPDGDMHESGYYEIADADVRPGHPNADDDVWLYDLSLVRAGTRGGSFRAIETNPRDVDHPFGSTGDEHVAIPESAIKVRWQDRDTLATTSASPDATVETAIGTLERYDVAAGRSTLGADRVRLVYDVAYAEDTLAVRAYDSNGAEDKLDLDDVRQWQAIHDSQHDVADPIVLSNHRTRLRVSEPDADAAGELSAEQWDDGAAEWQDVSLPEEGWSPVDLDITQIDQQRLDAQLLFEDDGGALQAVDLTLSLGLEAALVYEPADGDPIPADLESHLDPIAATTERDVRPERGLVERAEVRT